MGLGLNARSAPSGGFGSAWWTDEEMDKVKEPQAENRKGKAFVDGCDERMKDMNVLMKQYLLSYYKKLVGVESFLFWVNLQRYYHVSNLGLSGLALGALI